MAREKNNLTHAGKTARAKHAGRKQRRGTTIVCVFAVLLIGVGVMVLSTTSFGWHDPAAQSGYYAGKSYEEIQEELNRKLEEGLMSVSLRSTLYAKAGERDVEVRFQNSASNTMDQRLKLVMSDNTDDVLYYSQAISPNEYIETAKLNRAFDTPGTYAVTAVIEGYDRNNHAHVGDAGAEITLYVSE